MRFALIGTRGVPAQYGGFETALQEVGLRLVRKGHEVTVYGRGKPPHTRVWEGIRVVVLPALRRRSLETPTHTLLCVRHARSQGYDAVIVFNAANSVFVPWLHRAGIPAAVHVDGLEWKRSKWGYMGRRYYRLSEWIAVRVADALIADAQGIADYYRTTHKTDTWLIPYGAPLRWPRVQDGGRLAEIGVDIGAYHLVVARMEPENHVLEAIEGYIRSQCVKPLIVVGGNPYPNKYTRDIDTLARSDDRVHLQGSVWDQALLDDLYANCIAYIHGHSVGGTNPSLLRAMGAGALCVAWDVVFNREVLGEAGRFFSSPESLAGQLERAEAHGGEAASLGTAARERAAQEYRWDDVAERYELLLCALGDRGLRRRGKAP